MLSVVRSPRIFIRELRQLPRAGFNDHLNLVFYWAFDRFGDQRDAALTGCCSLFEDYDLYTIAT
jgi:hypothetical protein